MAERRRVDVWVVKLNRVFRNVPFTTVAERLQQGRLHADDRVREAGTTEWHRFDQDPLLFAYLPRPEPFRAEDQAEALESVDLGLSLTRRSESDDDDPDMIPLIDISLVLLIFFMMTAGSMITASPVETPPAESARVRVIKPKETVTVSMTMANDRVRFFLGDGAEQELSETELLEAVAAKLREGTVVEAVVKANPWIPYERVQQLLIGLETRGVKQIQAGVREKRIEEERP
jgi:biopolymer transport protein ExbD